MHDNDELQELEELICKANGMNEFVSTFNLIDKIVKNGNLSIRSCSAGSLDPNQKNQIFNILKSNMQQLYDAEKSWGWNDNDKSKELFSSRSKFLVVIDNSKSNLIISFAMFKFEYDDEEEPEHPVLFCYEVQIDKSYQQQGIGRILMDNLLSISKQTNMWKVMLTCFKSNENALKFYSKIGFGIDSNSPSSHGHLAPYEILSDKPKLK